MGENGSAMGEKLIRVIFATGRALEMSVNGGEAEVKIDGKKVVLPHAVLAGARRKIRA